MIPTISFKAALFGEGEQTLSASSREDVIFFGQPNSDRKAKNRMERHVKGMLESAASNYPYESSLLLWLLRLAPASSRRMVWLIRRYRCVTASLCLVTFRYVHNYRTTPTVWLNPDATAMFSWLLVLLLVLNGSTEWGIGCL